MTTTNSSVTTTLAANVDDLVLTGSADINGTGNALNNTITGNAGANVLDGRGGADTLIGGAGNDTYVVDNAGDRVVENADEGIDTVQSSVDHTLADGVENLVLTGWNHINGTGNALDNVITGNGANNILSGLDGNDTLVGDAGTDTLYGGAGNDTLSGGLGADTLDGGSGDDRLDGGAGDDTYVVDSPGDVVAELANAGTDTVRSSVDYTLGDNLEKLTLLGSADLAGTGNARDNTITGNDGANAIAAGAGADTVHGGAGDDSVLGGEGNDLLNGDAGNDSLSGEAGNDTLNGGLGADRMEGGSGDDTYVVDDAGDLVIEAAAAGTDTVQSSIAYTLTDQVEHLTLAGSAAIDGTGNELDNAINGNIGANALYGLEGNDTLNGNAGDDRLFGGAGNDTLDGGTGADVLQGDSGNDTYVVDSAADLVVELEGEGIDKVMAGVSYALADNVENMQLTGGAVVGTGNGLDNSLSGSDGNNVLNGMDGNDTLYGNGGNDTLDGGLGADNMEGGNGDDTYVVEQAGDKVTEGLYAGTDTVRSSIDYALTDNVEKLVLTGTDDLSGTGNALSNTMTGNAGNNSFAAGAGNDEVNAGDGADLVFGGDGNDALNGEAGEDRLYGEAGNDTINGGLGADRMEGGAGDDTYVLDDAGDLVIEEGGAGTDQVKASISYTLTDHVENLTLTGSADIDGTGNELDNVIIGNTGANALDGRAGNDTLMGNAGADLLVGGEGNDRLLGEAGEDRLQGDSGNDYLNGGIGADAMLGGSGNDTYIVDHAGDLVLEQAGEGVDLVESSIDYTLTAEVENLTLANASNTRGTGNELDNVITGNVGHNALLGLDGADTLEGMAGNDSLDGGVGADLMRGGTGDDSYVVDNAGDLVEELLSQGADTVNSSIDYTLTSNVEHLTLTGFEDLSGTGNALANTIIGNAGNNLVAAGDGADTVRAGGGADVVSGGNGNDILNGEGGDDRLAGDAGNDSINGGLGADWMAGGLGDDTFVVDDEGDLVVESAGEGTDLVNSGITYTLTDNVENLTLTGSTDLLGTGNELANVINGNTGANVLDGLAGDDTINAGMGNDVLIGGEGNDLLLGEAGDDVLQGDSGNDTLNGGIGSDSMLGGSGGDTYFVDNAGDLVTEHAGEGSDTVRSSVAHTLGDNVENLVLTGSGGIAGTGNALDNVITGNAASNALDGGAGNDTLFGDAGDDVLDGGTGSDTLQGGSGNDTYVIDDARDLVIEAANAGTADTVQSSIDYTLTANVERLVLTGGADLSGTGNALNNTITGNAGNNLIDGGAGTDTMIGGAGDDSYIVDTGSDVITEAAGGGIDTAYAGASYTLAANVEHLVQTGTAAINGSGNALDNTIAGNAANNVLNGMAGNDRIDAGAGNDTLDGGLGADTLLGGTGNDTYVVDDAADRVVEQADEGLDTVVSNIGYVLGAHVENLTLSGSAVIDGTGNALDNVINGNSGNNVLDGGAGADTLAGGLGNDTYLVDAGDSVVEAANAGIDTVRSGASYVLGANLENLVLLGDGDLDGTGNALANNILGTAGANRLDGGAGADTLAGGAGDDTYVVDQAGDVVSEAAGEGVDTVLASASYTLAANVESLVLTGTANLQGSGNAGDNHLTGNSGANQLDGGAGADTLLGGAGNDTLLGGEGNDSLDGGLDADMMQGGAGDDTYVVDHAGDTIAESAGNGTDTVLASASHTLAANVENLVLTGGANLSGAGNAQDNTLSGNGGDNQLSGMDGNDLLAGGAGNDLLLGGAGDDTYLFGVGDGHDRIIDAQGGGTLHFKDGLTAADLHAEQSGRDLVLTIAATGDSVVLVDWLAQAEGVTRIVFDDGSAIDHGGMAALLNAAPTAAADSVDVHEDGGVANVPVTQLLANDTDPDQGDVLSVIAVGESGIGAAVTLEDGLVGYDIGARFQELAQGEVVNDSFTYTVSDEMGETSTAVVNVQVIGVNDAAVAVADSAAVTEDALTTAGGNVLDNDSDIDRGTVLQVAAPGTYAGTYGTLELALDGSYTYRLNDGAANVQALNAGEVVTDSFAYVATDGIEGVASTLDIAITGTNDAPLLAADTAQVVEDTAPAASGNLLANDSDVDAGTVLAVDAGSFAGSHGELTLNADGSYVYQLDAARVQSLGRNDSVVEHFTYGATDGIVRDTATLDITVAGTNDAPIVVAPLADRDLTFNKAFSFKLPENSFKDLDKGDTLTYSATLADGSELPDWLKFDAATGTFSGKTPKKVGAIDVRVTATDQAANGGTDGSLSASDVFTLSVSHGNAGVGNGPDAPPAGHDSNHNDGPGTGPGNPGAKGGRKFGLSIGITASSGVASVALTATAEQAGPLGVPAVLSVSKMIEYGTPSSSIGNTTSAQSFGAWLAVDLAVSEALAEKKSLTWLGEKTGADTGALAQATVGFLGSTSGFGGVGLSLSGTAGVELKGFDGLGKGTKKIK
jgi:VCBS repeat-containing protein